MPQLSTTRERASVGLITGCTVPSELKETLNVSFKTGFEFIASCFAHPHCLAVDGKNECVELPQISCADLLLTSSEWNRMIVGMISEWIDCDSNDPKLRLLSEKALHEELEYAKYLALPVVLVKLKSRNVLNLGRIINSHMVTNPPFQIWVWVQTSCSQLKKSRSDVIIQNTVEETSNSTVVDNNGTLTVDDGYSTVPKQEMDKCEWDDPWEWWNTLRSMCLDVRRISLALEVTGELADSEAENRWRGEPIKAVILNTDAFSDNAKSFPVLSRSLQLFVARLMIQLQAQVLLKQGALIPGRSLQNYRQYVDHLYQKFKTEKTSAVYEAWAHGYEDHLQYPLQPLADNLESATYEVFEKDPVKYTEYRTAIIEAMKDTRNKSSFQDGAPIRVAILGAGRGPLVRAVLDAAKEVKLEAQVFSVEKNPHAVVTLRYYQEAWTKEGRKVEIVHSDMREWRPEELVDIVVSELLGSFGDNELSPECLDNSLPYILKPDGINIPQSYKSFIGPIQSQKLWSEVKAAIDFSKPDAHFDQSYVVRVHNRYEIDSPKPVFEFSHCPPYKQKDETRFTSVMFSSRYPAVVHGFVGYFETVLYKDIMLSTVPTSHSRGMFSWFPIFFPLRTPVKVKKHEEIELLMWRLTDNRKVWYEWVLSKPIVTNVQNTSGQHQAMQLYV